RNRVIAALTRGTVVVEAAARSGSRATLHRARDMGRAAMAVPGPVTSAMSVGSHSEIRDGRTSLVTSTAEVLEEVGRIGEDLAPLPRGVEQPRDKLTPEAVRLLDAIPAQRPAGAESIAIAAGLGISEVNRLLPLLLLAGMIEEAEQGYRLTAAHRAPSSGRRHPRPRLR
ncbi:MAG: DNA-processing protein DprA, partial [Micromonosporaceae bacterium]